MDHTSYSDPIERPRVGSSKRVALLTAPLVSTALIVATAFILTPRLFTAATHTNSTHTNSTHTNSTHTNSTHTNSTHTNPNQTRSLTTPAAITPLDASPEAPLTPTPNQATREFFGYWITAATNPLSLLPQDFGRFGPGNSLPYEVNSWEFDKAFESEAFRFVRIRFSDRGYRSRPGGKWYTDFPDCDLNFSFRLHQLTTLNVNPEPLYLDLTDPRIFDFPFLYMIEPGFIALSNAEARAMREYLDRGGFIMVDDFWGEEEWYNFSTEMRKVFPDREPVDVPLEHSIFHLVYDLPIKPQIPSIHNWMRFGVTWERSDAREVHYRAFFDDDDRIQMFICHNTDLGDGWEREGESREYFEMFSEKYAYPLGINIVVYAMTH